MALGSLVVKIVGDNSQFNKTIANTQKELNKQTKGLQTVAKSMSGVGDSMTKGITVPIAAIGAVLVKVGTEFDDAYDKIRIGTGATGEVLEGLKTDFKEVAKDSASSFSDISTTISELNTRLGLTGKPLQTLTTQMTNLARITDSDINTLIPATTRVFGDWAISTEKQSEALDYMYRVSQNTGIGIDQLSEKVVFFGAPLRQMGFDFETSAALIGKWEKEGVNAELVLGSLRIALGKFASAGVTDTNAALLELIDKIKGAGSTGEATAIAIEAFGRKAGPDMAAAIREGRFDLDTLLEQLKNGTDTINGAADATDDWMEKLKKLKNNAMIELEPVANKVFDSITRAVDRLGPKIEDLADWFGDLTESQTDNLLKWGLIFAAIGPVLSITGRMITSVIQLRNGILTLNKAIQASPLFTAAAAAATMYAIAAGVEALTDKIDNKLVKALVNTAYPMAGWLNSGKENIEVLKALKDGTISWKDAADINIFTIDEHIKKIRRLREEKEQDVDATGNVANSTKNYTDLLGESTPTVDKYKVSLESMGKEAEESAESIDELRASFNELTKDIFGGITTYNDFQEAGWAVEAAEKALAEAIKEHGENSQEAEQAQNNLDDANLNAINTAFELSTQVGVTTEKQEEARRKAVELGLQYVATGDIGIEAFIEMATQFGLSGKDIIKDAEEMGITLDWETRSRLIEVGIDLTGFNENIAYIHGQLAGLGANAGLIHGNYANGGIVSASKGINLPKFDNGGVLAMLHPPEVVLNGKEALQLVWNMATKPAEEKSDNNSAQSILIENKIELDGQVIYQKTSNYQGKSVRTNLIGQGIK